MKESIIFEGHIFTRDVDKKRATFRRSKVVSGTRSHEYLHRRIWELANGPIVFGMQVRHIDGDPTNNNLDNLKCVWTTGSPPKRSHHKQEKPDSKITKSGYISIGFEDDPIPIAHKKRNYPTKRKSPRGKWEK